MSQLSNGLLPELPEGQATGRIAQIYDEIRPFSGVPYVSSLQRYLATMPGVLEWAWAVVRPAMVSGAIPETGWRLARSVRTSPLPRVSVAVLRVWGVDEGELAAIRNVAENFVRVSPVNLMMGGCLRLVLNGPTPSGAGLSDGWEPPRMLSPMPGNVEPMSVSPELNSVLIQLATEVDEKPFIPALYRQLAHWPCLLAWLATELGPRFDAPETRAARAALRDAAWQAAQGIVDRLPAPTMAGPDREVKYRILATIDRYAETSPEMVMFGQLLLEALPEPE